MNQERAEDYSSKTYQASPDYIYRKVADSHVLISINANKADFSGFLQLNQTGSELWSRLQQPCTAEDLARVLEENYGLDHGEALADALDFIRDLSQREMVVLQ